MTAKQYRKRPVVVEAMQHEGNLMSANSIVDWIQKNGGKAQAAYVGKAYIYIETLEGEMRADPLDYIIKGVNGEFYPCKPDIFRQTYEEVTE